MTLREFVPLAALMTSLVALSIDAMLPALGQIGEQLGLSDPNRAQLVVGSMLLGLGLGQLFYGPVSDSVGRKPCIHVGLGIFIAASIVATLAHDFDTLLIARFAQGFGAAGPRTLVLAIVRDRYQGNEMARVMSFVMTVFILVPTIAPAIGQAILWVESWRSIFALFIVLAVAALTWCALRMPESLLEQYRRPFSAHSIGSAIVDVLSSREAIGYTLATGFIFAAFVGYLSSSQQIFVDLYAVGDWFPAYFGALALGLGAASYFNARIVRRLGMARLALRAGVGACSLSALWLLVVVASDGKPHIALLMGLLLLIFLAFGFMFGNLNSLAMQPLQHVAGLGAAVVGALSTSISVPIGASIGQAFDGTLLPLAVGFVLFSALCVVAQWWAGRSSG